MVSLPPPLVNFSSSVVGKGELFQGWICLTYLPATGYCYVFASKLETLPLLDLFSMCKYLYAVIKLPLNLLFDKLNKLKHLKSHNVRFIFQALDHFCIFSFELCPVFPHLSWRVDMGTGHTNLVVVLPMLCTDTRSLPYLCLPFLYIKGSHEPFLPQPCNESSCQGGNLQWV